MLQDAHKILPPVQFRKLAFTIFCFVYIFLSTGSTYCQQFSLSPNLRFDNYNVTDEYCGEVLRATNGYVWIGENGLLRFDGKQYIQYNSNINSQHHGLRSNYVAYIVEDAYGKVWMGSGGGLCYYNERLDKFNYIDIDSIHKIEYAYALCLLKNELWFKCNFGLCHMDLKTLKVKTTSLDFKTGAFLSYPLDSNTILISENTGSYYLYHIKEDKYENRTIGKYKGIVINSITKSKNKLWIATQSGLWVSDNINDMTSLVKGTENLPVNDVRVIPAVTGDSILWIAADVKGLLLYNINKGKIEYAYTHDSNNPYSICGNYITNIFVDDKNLIWMAAEKGISMLNYKNQSLNEYLFPNKYIMNITQDKYKKDIVWLSILNEGLSEMDWANKKILRHVSNKIINKKGIHDSVWDMLQLSKNKWLLLTLNRILVWDSKTGVKKDIHQIPVEQKTFPLYLRHIIPYNKDSCFITSNSGLYIYNIASGVLDTVMLRHDDIDPSFLDITNGTYDGKKDLWIATKDGLLNYNIETKKREIYKVDDTIYNGNYMTDAVPDKNHHIICATATGIAIFDIATKKYHFFSEFKSIRHPACYSITITDSIAWLNSNAGIISFNIYTWESYILHDSYSVFPFGHVNDELVLAMRDKYISFKPALVSKPHLPSQLIIEKVVINNIPHYFPDKENIELKYDQNTLDIYFTAFNFYDPVDIQFRYKLDGLDNNWNYAENQRYANYTHVPPGTYTFVVQTGNRNGVWYNNPVYYSFTILPPYWQTWWFRLSLLVGFISLVVGIALMRIKIIRKQEIEKTAVNKEIAEMELKALRSQMNPHFIFNSLNSIQKFIWENKQEDAAEYLTKFSRLIRMILENSMQKWITLEQELSALSLYLELEHRRCNNKFDYLIDIDNKLDTASILFPPLILQPYVENAIWHGLINKEGRGTLMIVITKQEDNMVRCVIEDNGIGRDAAEKMKESRNIQSASYGMKITKQRLEMLYEHEKNGALNIEDLYDEKNSACGTRIIINIPVSSFIKV